MPKSKGIVAVTNHQDRQIRFILEPWADEVMLSPGESVQVSFTGPSDGLMEFEVTEGDVILYGWDRSVLEVVGKKSSGTT